MEPMQTRVDRGAAWLDQQEPGWWGRLDPSTLSMLSLKDCVLGQVFGGFELGLIHANAVGIGPWAGRYGFTLTAEDSELARMEDRLASRQLADLWLDAVKERANR